tara:strand:- start:496 stop:1041 length:546 start_codon:yes stop_codon:yes gene_type:complete
VNKSSIRKRLLKLRKNNYSKSFIINSNNFLKFFENIKLEPKSIGGYYPFNYELDILNILEVLEKKDYNISLPKISKNNEMNFYKWSSVEPLKLNKFGIPEPISEKKIFPNILLIPLVGFDYQLNRLGYGGGYYDRYLSKEKVKKKIIKIGVGFSFQRVKKLPIDKHDKRLDCIFTEKKIIK